MTDLPRARVQLDQQAVAGGSGLDILTVIACVAQNADAMPRVFSSIDALLEQHLYAPGVDYCAMHVEETKLPVIFCGVPIAVPGTVGRIDASGNTGTSVVSVAVGADGALEQLDGIVTVIRGGVVGTDQILLGLVLDGGFSDPKTIRLGTATSYVIEHYGLTLSAGAGSLVTGDTVLRFSTTAPLWDADGIADARAALAAQQKQSRNWNVIGDVPTLALGSSVLTQINAYATANDRCSLARIAARDRKVQAAMSRVHVRMTGTPTITFAEVGGTGDTITRSAGSFITDGFAVNMTVSVSGSGSNNFTHGKITAVSATVLTLDTQDLVAEGPVPDVVIIGSHALTFAEVGATGDTITRSGGSWLADGFAAGDLITVAGTVSNNFADKLVTAVTATVLTLDTQDLTAEVIGSASVTITAGETDADWKADIEDEFEDLDGEPRLDIGAGRAFKQSPITGWFLRRSAAWAASIREYQHDIHVATWRKDLGVLSGWFLEKRGVKVEHDELTDGGLLLGRFTCFRTYSNGPSGTFIAMSLTRADDGSLLSRTHNMHVANLACNIVQGQTELVIGIDIELNEDGTATEDSLTGIEGRVNSALSAALLQNAKGEGKRASDVRWVASRDDVLNVTGAELTGTVDLRLKGTIEKINTRVRVQTAG
jgi:hypothetical protein